LTASFKRAKSAAALLLTSALGLGIAAPTYGGVCLDTDFASRGVRKIHLDSTKISALRDRASKFAAIESKLSSQMVVVYDLVDQTSNARAHLQDRVNDQQLFDLIDDEFVAVMFDNSKLNLALVTGEHDRGTSLSPGTKRGLADENKFLGSSSSQLIDTVAEINATGENTLQASSAELTKSAKQKSNSSSAGGGSSGGSGSNTGSASISTIIPGANDSWLPEFAENSNPASFSPSTDHPDPLADILTEDAYVDFEPNVEIVTSAPEATTLISWGVGCLIFAACSFVVKRRKTV